MKDENLLSLNPSLPAVWSMREFEVSPETKVDCAMYQMIVDCNGTAILFSGEYSNKQSTGVQIMKERLTEMVEKLNYR